MDRLQAMKVFVAVVDAQGFAGAARQLNLSPPAVTRAIHDLENLLGVRLLTRTTRVVRVTEAGARHVEDCRRILAQLAEADASVTGLHTQPRGQLVITAPALFGAMFVTPVVTEYLRRYPEVNATCLFLDRVVNMLDEGVDVAVRIGELPDSSFQAVRLGSVRRLICASPAYLAEHGTPETPDELGAHRIISSSSIQPTPEWRLMHNGTSRLFKVQPRMRTTTNDSAIAAALNGFGVTRVLSYQIAEHLREGRLVTVLAAYEPVAWPVHVVHREGQNATQRVRAFLDLVIERLRGAEGLQ